MGTVGVIALIVIGVILKKKCTQNNGKKKKKQKKIKNYRETAYESEEVGEVQHLTQSVEDESNYL